MKAAPSAIKSGDAILGRKREIQKLWCRLDLGSVLFTAERRVGKTCVLRKMSEYPVEGKAVVLCYVEKSRHPSDLVGVLYTEAKRHALLSDKGNWLVRFGRAYEKLAGTQIAGWSLPPVRSAWKGLFEILIEDIVENSSRQVIIIFDELPHMLNNLIAAKDHVLAAELLDTLRELRQHHQSSGKFRFLLTGSIGLHLIVDELKKNHGYKGSPTNDLFHETLSGLYAEDVDLFCHAFLDSEGIRRLQPDRFNRTMRRATDGLPLYIEYVCEAFQAAKSRAVGPTDIDHEIRRLLDSTNVDWFSDAASRINTHYARLGADRMAREILRHICRVQSSVPEEDIIRHLRSQMAVEYDDAVLNVLELLRKDHYIERTIRSGRRRYRFLYQIMRRWWRLNKG